MTTKHHKKNEEPEAQTSPEIPIVEAALEPEGVAERVAEPAPERQPPVNETAVLKDQLLRLQADFDNYRKRMARQQIEMFQRATEDILKDLIPVLDHFELGLNTAASHKTEKSVQDGFRMVFDQFENALKKYGLTPVESTSVPFDPNLHEAITHVPSEEHPADTIVAQTRRGFKLGDKLIRPAQVIISSGPTPTPIEAP